MEIPDGIVHQGFVPIFVNDPHDSHRLGASENGSLELRKLLDAADFVSGADAAVD